MFSFYFLRTLPNSTSIWMQQQLHASNCMSQSQRQRQRQRFPVFNTATPLAGGQGRALVEPPDSLAGHVALAMCWRWSPVGPPLMFSPTAARGFVLRATLQIIQIIYSYSDLTYWTGSQRRRRHRDGTSRDTARVLLQQQGSPSDRCRPAIKWKQLVHKSIYNTH